jgi:hypothetical protein
MQAAKLIFVPLFFVCFFISGAASVPGLNYVNQLSEIKNDRRAPCCSSPPSASQLEFSDASRDNTQHIAPWIMDRQ